VASGGSVQGSPDRLREQDGPVGADFFAVVEEIKEKLHAPAVPVQIPIGKEGPRGVIDLIEQREIRWDADTNGENMDISPVAAERADYASEWREKLIDALASHSDEITELYLGGEDIPADLLRKSLRAATISRAMVPIFCGASRRNIGVQPLIDAIVDFLPARTKSNPRWDIT
jgi:elongation factor G